MMHACLPGGHCPYCAVRTCPCCGLAHHATPWVYRQPWYPVRRPIIWNNGVNDAINRLSGA